MRSGALLVLLFAACAPQYEIDGRPYALSVPPDPRGPLPLIVLLHGYGASGEVQDVVLPFSRDVAARKFLYAMPNGTVNPRGRRFWNATDACCNFEGSTVDDVAFLKALIADVKQHHDVDPRRVFLIGHSNGAFMALRMVCDASADVTAVMALSGATPPTCHAGKPVNVLLVHGDADDVIHYEGGTTETGTYDSADHSLQTIAARNGCGTQRASAGIGDFVGDPKPETTKDKALGCPTGGAAELWTLKGEGHVPLVNDAFRASVLDWLMREPRP